MEGPVESVPLRIWNRQDTHTTPRTNIPLRKYVKLNISTNSQPYLGRLKWSQKFRSQRVTQTMSIDFNSYSLSWAQTTSDDNPLQMSEDLTEHCPSEIEISDLWNTQDAFERMLKFHSIPELNKYIHSRSLLCVPDIDGWGMKDLFHRIFLSSDPENQAPKELVYDCLYMPWLTGDFMSEFAPEWAGSYLLVLQKPSHRVAFMASHQLTSGDGPRDKSLFELHNKRPPKHVSTLKKNFKQLVLSKDDVSHWLYWMLPTFGLSCDETAARR